MEAVVVIILTLLLLGIVVAALVTVGVALNRRKTG
jgi:hypothetical protein